MGRWFIRSKEQDGLVGMGWDVIGILRKVMIVETQYMWEAR